MRRGRAAAGGAVGAGDGARGHEEEERVRAGVDAAGYAAAGGGINSAV